MDGHETGYGDTYQRSVEAIQAVTDAPRIISKGYSRTCTNGTSSQDKQAHEEGVATNAYKHQCARQRIALKHDLSHTTEYTFHHLD